MKGYINRIILVFWIVLFVGANVAVPNLNGGIVKPTIITSLKNSTEPLGEMNDYQNYSHTVFVGIATSQICPPCHIWNQHIHEVYVSGDYDFEYVEMIEYDHEGNVLNQKAREWAVNYNIVALPTSIFDGDYQRIVGDKPENLPDTLNESGSRDVADITANITLSWLGNATTRVNITIKNNETIQYIGHIRAFITEIVSRYDTKEGDPYNFGFLDYAFDKDISIDADEEYVNSTVWNGNEHEDNHGNDFGDLTKNNTQVTLVIYNSDGYVDESVLGRIKNNPPDMPAITGPTSGIVGESYDYNFDTIDPDGDDVYYYIEWGDDSYDNWFGPFSSGEEATASHTWYSEGDFDITAKAKDTYDEEGDWSNPYWVRIGNHAPYAPNIDGPTNGNIGEKYEYTFNTIDPEGDDVYYWIEWFENDPEAKWEGPYLSGEEVSFNHTWNEKGTFTITAKAKDEFSAEGPEGTLEVTMPKDKPFIFNFPLMSWLFERFPMLERLLSLIKMI